MGTETIKTNGSTLSVDDAAVTMQVKGVSKYFGSRAAVDNLTFHIQKGEAVGFLGPNGSGKTTTMRMLTSYYTPDNGAILINNLDTRDHEKITKTNIGYLPENNPLYGDLLVKEYLEFVSDLRGMNKTEKKQNIDRTIDETGLSEYFYRPVNQLSKGFRQRVGLAQAILHRPSILILDEPTEGLDPNQRITIRDLIRSLGEERTVLLSTHIMQEVEATCERVLVISRGRLIADSPVTDLLKHAQNSRSIYLEIEGNEVESRLQGLPSVTSVERMEPIAGRKRYTISILPNEDPRPDIFHMAKRRDWVLWDLHEETARLEDVFHSLTTEAHQEEI